MENMLRIMATFFLQLICITNCERCGVQSKVFSEIAYLCIRSYIVMSISFIDGFRPLYIPLVASRTLEPLTYVVRLNELSPTSLKGYSHQEVHSCHVKA